MKKTSLKNLTLKISKLNKLISDKKSSVKRKKCCRRRLFIKPYQLSNFKQSIKEILDSEITTYDEGLKGIILSYKNIKVYTFAKDNPGEALIPVDYIADVYIFKPKVGSVLTGTISKKSRHEIGCLVHKIFNITIPRPENVSIPEWLENDLSVGSKVTFNVVEVDLDSSLPFIKGLILSS